MTAVIDQKIVAQRVVAESVAAAPHPETLEREEVLNGRTHKIKPSDVAWYITINDIVLDDGSRRPYEIFINTKDVAHQQWVQVVSRLISAVWRKGGDYRFVIEEMQCIADPVGPYPVKGKGFMPSIVAHIGHVIEEHLKYER